MTLFLLRPSYADLATWALVIVSAIFALIYKAFVSMTSHAFWTIRGVLATQPPIMASFPFVFSHAHLVARTLMVSAISMFIYNAM